MIWKRWFAWYPVKLQFGGYVWLRSVEYEQYNTIPITGAFAGGSRTITHYRLLNKRFKLTKIDIVLLVGFIYCCVSVAYMAWLISVPLEHLR